MTHAPAVGAAVLGRGPMEAAGMRTQPPMDSPKTGRPQAVRNPWKAAGRLDLEKQAEPKRPRLPTPPTGPAAGKGRTRNDKIRGRRRPLLFTEPLSSLRSGAVAAFAGMGGRIHRNTHRRGNLRRNRHVWHVAKPQCAPVSISPTPEGSVLLQRHRTTVLVLDPHPGRRGNGAPARQQPRRRDTPGLKLFTFFGGQACVPFRTAWETCATKS